MTFSIRLTEEERCIVDSYARRHSISAGEAFKRALFERIENEDDAAIADEACKEYEDGGKKSRPIENLWRELEMEDGSVNLKEVGIDFHIDKFLENDLFALFEGIQNNVSYVDCLRDQLLSSVHASYNAGLLTADQAEFIEQNFIFNN